MDKQPEKATTTHLPPSWREHLIAVLGGHPDSEKLRFLAAWAQVEGGVARWNPLNSTLKIPGSTTLPGNTAGVQEYTRPIWGVCATAMTLSNPASGNLYYPKLLAHLQSSAGTYTAGQIVNECEAEISKWGTNVTKLKQILAATPKGGFGDGEFGDGDFNGD